jgi:hypothetical protein
MGNLGHTDRPYAGVDGDAQSMHRDGGAETGPNARTETPAKSWGLAVSSGGASIGRDRVRAISPADTKYDAALMTKKDPTDTTVSSADATAHPPSSAALFVAVTRPFAR